MEHTKTIDPMCGREIKERDPKYASEVEGRIHFFCSHACKRSFDRGVSVVSERKARAGEPVH
jgi:YHS domain-containing protein